MRIKMLNAKNMMKGIICLSMFLFLVSNCCIGPGYHEKEDD